MGFVKSKLPLILVLLSVFLSSALAVRQLNPQPERPEEGGSSQTPVERLGLCLKWCESHSQGQGRELVKCRMQCEEEFRSESERGREGEDIEMDGGSPWMGSKDQYEQFEECQRKCQSPGQKGKGQMGQRQCQMRCVEDLQSQMGRESESEGGSGGGYRDYIRSKDDPRERYQDCKERCRSETKGSHGHGEEQYKCVKRCPDEYEKDMEKKRKGGRGFRYVMDMDDNDQDTFSGSGEGGSRYDTRGKGWGSSWECMEMCQKQGKEPWQCQRSCQPGQGQHGGRGESSYDTGSRGKGGDRGESWEGILVCQQRCIRQQGQGQGKQQQQQQQECMKQCLQQQGEEGGRGQSRWLIPNSYMEKDPEDQSQSWDQGHGHHHHGDDSGSKTGRGDYYTECLRRCQEQGQDPFQCHNTCKPPLGQGQQGSQGYGGDRLATILELSGLLK